jgi:DNA-binding XRE family transcriptional regulator
MTGNELKTWRENCFLSQEKLAITLDVSLSTIARWEQLKDKNLPNSKLLEFALNFLELKIGNIQAASVNSRVRSENF